jgi:hypothetical protein
MFTFRTGLTVTRFARVNCIMLRIIGTGSVLIPDTLQNYIFRDISMLSTIVIRAVLSRFLKYPFAVRLQPHE